MSQCEAAESSSQVTPQVIDGKERSSLDEVLRQGARQMLVKAVEAEVTAYIQAHQHEVDEDGRRLVVRNGHARERTLVSGAGQLKIQAPRVDDRRVDERGPTLPFHFPDPAAVSAAHEKRRRTHPLVVPERDLDGRFQ